MQPDTNETGRSMVEMLGVLAIIGVLSIGGIQGYTYAMNKYRANNVLNEVNMASHQLATALVTSRNAQKMLSLGNPYDNGTMTTENYPFDYGCGNEGTTERACQQAEQGYWVSVGGVTEKVCQNMLSESGFLPYVAETKLNGETVTDGENCAEEDNEIMFLFNADGSGELAENVGGDNSDDEDETEVPETCPENTSVGGQGGFVTTITDKETGNVLNCHCTEKDTKYSTETKTCETLPEKCSSNKDCNNGEYCHINNVENSEACLNNTSGMEGTCKTPTLKTPAAGTTPPFDVSQDSMNWWSAKHFCQALGREMANLNDFQCEFPWMDVNQGYASLLGMCFKDVSQFDLLYSPEPPVFEYPPVFNVTAEAYGSVNGWIQSSLSSNPCYGVVIGISTSQSMDNGMVLSGDKNAKAQAICKNSNGYVNDKPEEKIECSTNADCKTGEYCLITDYGSDVCTKDTSGMSGICQNTEAHLLAKPLTAPFWMSNKLMDWRSAKNFCQALGKTMVSLSDFGCAHTFCRSGCDSEGGYCQASSESSRTDANAQKSSVMESMINAYGNKIMGGWTDTDHSSCVVYAFLITPLENGLGGVGPFSMDPSSIKLAAACK